MQSDGTTSGNTTYKLRALVSNERCVLEHDEMSGSVRCPPRCERAERAQVGRSLPEPGRGRLARCLVPTAGESTHDHLDPSHGRWSGCCEELGGNRSRKLPGSTRVSEQTLYNWSRHFGYGSGRCEVPASTRTREECSPEYFKPLFLFYYR